ncbi:ATP-dependent DNA helicase [Bacillus aquiflavi]|uniref:ATP-dependent DNA helicase n=1 Tax=Bacillus aquiflavi TaxID=2672567 RepID=A0A6B3VYP3_9BACI|nr:ATP-dependent DNA helicase [Bacillus aquiflavi]MBA4536110.1 ATP-dependent DNA helicase [Bacillus aquiflavi]NEY80484.1 ATP-dependent DNA helicase [Bacillus aquiflavi]UAC47049.1 ATP-dependent DNA helicase [Bacillus aquiflavi]
MNMLFAAILFLTSWFYTPVQTPTIPVEVESIDLNLKENELGLTFFFLSDGEATLIQHGNGENILINTGGEGTEKELERLLELYDVKNISAIVLTKISSYCNVNLKWLIEQYDVNELIASSYIVQGLKQQYAHLQMKELKTGTKQQILPHLVLESLFDGNKKDEGTDISFRFFNHRIFYMSSTSKRAEQSLMDQQLSDVNVVKLPGFGEESGISEKLIKHMDPQVAILFYSNEVKPSSELFKKLSDTWIDVYFTKKHGTVSLKFTNSNYDIITISNDNQFE